MADKRSRNKSIPAVPPTNEKTPYADFPGPGRLPVAAPLNTEGHLRFRFADVDHGGKWPLTKIAKADHIQLLKKLKHYERMTVHDAKRTGALADYDMAKCPNKDATKRLAEQFNGRDDLARLKVTEVQRLLGFRVGNEFSIVWWDPGHAVWPSG
ncbi:hypothetical protein SRABI83_02278 [Arthrobacter sp. Bi83]|uniref:hypothetical protein n=1 Tax=Arthrobacter sp. Bi83 TaxID=2822353 RepID=UPI001DD992AB|nr:hypothetical protein [Arthrobacter sp. Bi83]CAH0216736.1 hypothetical protein SRABI83_02278 [Arthrobacter sp. Bi83]